MADLYIPNLHTFAMENPFTGSCGEFRFKINPEVAKITPKEVDFANSTLKAWYWHGPFCFEKSEMEGEQTFPLSEEGREALKSWLEENI